MTDLPRHPGIDGRVVDATLHLLDRQLLDRDGIPSSVVDDLLLDERKDGPPVIASLVLGSGIVSRFLGGHPPLHRLFEVPWRHVSEIKSAIHLGISREDIDALWRERWLRTHVIAKIPGGRDAAE
jgi:hypothetical protein